MNLCALGGLFLLTQAFQDVHKLDPLAAGLLTLPAMLPLPLLGAPAGRLSTRIGVWLTAALGLLVAAAGMVGIAASLTNTGTGYIVLAYFLTLWGTGLGVLTPAIVAAALKATPRHLASPPVRAAPPGRPAERSASRSSPPPPGLQPRLASAHLRSGRVAVLVRAPVCTSRL